MGQMDDEGVRLLAPLRNAHLDDESGIDVTRAMRTGKRHQRNRVITGVLAVASLAVLAMVVVPSLVGHQAITPAVPMVNEFDMYKQVMQVGTAGGFEPYNYRTGRFEQAADVGHTPGGRGYGRVTIYAQGHQPSIDTRERAADVNGMPAYWQPGRKDPTLAVNWTDNGWAIIWATSDTDLDIVDRTHRLAQGVTFTGATVAAVVPFTLPARPPGDPLRLVGLMQNRDWMSGQVLLSTSDETGALVLAINVGWNIVTPSKANTQYNGSPAFVDDKSFTMFSADSNGCVVSVRYEDVARLGGIEQLKALAGSVTPIADHRNHSAWKTSPWR